MSYRRRRRQGPEAEYEKLLQALARAILASDELGPLLENLMSRGLFGPADLLIITLQAPNERGKFGLSLGHMKDEPDEEKASDSDELAPYLIDGKRLSPQEIAFEEYYSSKFDEAFWLKKNQLTLKKIHTKRKKNNASGLDPIRKPPRRSLP